jgi:hypothetical protein
MIYGQSYENDTIILKSAMLQRQSNNIVYLDTSVGWTRIKKNLHHRAFRGITMPTKQNKLRLTKSEYKYLLQQVKKYENYVWDSNLFNNSKRISADSMWTYLDNEKRVFSKIRENAIMNKDTLTLRKLRYPLWVYGFSKPIYFRNNNICLLYYVAMCGNPCGHDAVCFYKKEDNKWTKWIEIDGGDY